MLTRTITAILLSGVVLAGQSKASIDGTWKLNQEESNPRPPEASTSTMTITQNGTDVTVSFASPHGTNATSYRMGQETRTEAPTGMKSKVLVSRQGAQLVFNGTRSTPDNRELPFSRTMMASPDGKRLFVEETMSGQYTQFKALKVYDRVQ